MRGMIGKGRVNLEEWEGLVRSIRYGERRTCWLRIQVNLEYEDAFSVLVCRIVSSTLIHYRGEAEGKEGGPYTIGFLKRRSIERDLPL